MTHENDKFRRLTEEQKAEIAKNFSEKLTLLMEREEITKQQLAEYLGVDKKTIQRMRNGYYFPTSEMVYNIAEKYNVSIDWLLGRYIVE